LRWVSAEKDPGHAACKLTSPYAPSHAGQPDFPTLAVLRASLAATLPILRSPHNQDGVVPWGPDP
jgi:hypothetical protein